MHHGCPRIVDSIKAALQAKSQLKRVGCSVVGAVLNGISHSRDTIRTITAITGTTRTSMRTKRTRIKARNFLSGNSELRTELKNKEWPASLCLFAASLYRPDSQFCEASVAQEDLLGSASQFLCCFRSFPTALKLLGIRFRTAAFLSRQQTRYTVCSKRRPGAGRFEHIAGSNRVRSKDLRRRFVAVGRRRISRAVPPGIVPVRHPNLFAAIFRQPAPLAECIQRQRYHALFFLLRFTSFQITFRRVQRMGLRGRLPRSNK